MNAFTVVMRDELVAAFSASDADDAVRAVIVTGAAARFVQGPIFPAVAIPSTLRCVLTQHVTATR